MRLSVLKKHVLRSSFTYCNQRVGNIIYYNVIHNEYKVEFNDMSSDYIRPEDIDGVEVILLTA